MKLLARWRARKPADDEQPVYVSERYGVRSLHIGSDTIQSSMRIARPLDLELAYTRSMMAFLLFAPRPAEVLMIGLGGGSLAKFIHHRMSQTRVRVIEVSERVVTIARQQFNVPADGDTFEVIVADGAEHVRREDVHADVLMLDGYVADSHVAQLASKPFYSACLRRLNPGGVLVVNLWGGERTFHDILQRIQTTFTGGTLCLPAERPGNIIVFGFERGPGPLYWRALEQHASILEAQYGLDFTRFVEGLRKMNRHDHDQLYV
jgi:spermidine synthase